MFLNRDGTSVTLSLDVNFGRASVGSHRFRTADSLIYGSDEQIVNNKLNDEELLQLFNKVQQLSDQDVTSVKAMLKAFVFQKDIQKQLA